MFLDTITEEIKKYREMIRENDGKKINKKPPKKEKPKN